MKKLLHLVAKYGRARMLFYAIVAISLVLFALFFLIGFNRPYRIDPNFNEPALTSVLIIFVLIMLVLAIGTALWALVLSLRHRGVGKAFVNGVPAMKIAVGVAGVTVLVMLLTFMLGSSQALRVNGKVFDSTLSLKAADMFVASSVVMILLAIAAVVFGAIYTRLKNR